MLQCYNLRIVTSDIREFSKTHAKLKPLGLDLLQSAVFGCFWCIVWRRKCYMRGAKRNRKADKDYHADFFEQQRRNDGYQDALEKLTARRCLDMCGHSYVPASPFKKLNPVSGSRTIRGQKHMNQFNMLLSS